MQNQGIYIFKNTMNNKVYIGSSVNLTKRRYEHTRLLNLGQHENKHFQNAWNKYGESNFEYDILEIVPILNDLEENNKQLRNIETRYILKYKSADPEFGYNFIAGGLGSQGIPCSEEKKKKIAEANKGRVAYNKGIEMSEEQKQLLREINSEKYGKPIDIYTINKVFLETLPSIREVYRKYGTSRNCIKDCCDNIRTPKNLIFRYHGDSLDSIGINKSIKTEEELKESAKKYRQSKGKSIDIYDANGNFIETLPAIVEVHEKYSFSESTIRRGLKEKCISGGMFFRYSGEPLGNISEEQIKYNPKSAKNNQLYFEIYENDILIDTLKYKKDVEEKYSVYREKSELQKLLKQCIKYGDEFIYHQYKIKFTFAPNNSNIISESRQLSDNTEGTSDSANGEA